MAGTWRWKAAQWAERSWWKNYLKGRDVREYLSWKKTYWQNLLEQCTPWFRVNGSHRVLDAGCGPAGIFLLFPEGPATAFDPLIDSYEQDLPHFRKSWYPGVEFIRAGLENFRSEKRFDVIFCMNAINHVQDLPGSYDNLLAHAAPGAWVVITIDAHNHAFFKHLFRLLPGDILHPHQYDLAEYKRMMTDRGCTVEGVVHLKHEFFFDHYMLIGRMP